MVKNPEISRADIEKLIQQKSLGDKQVPMKYVVIVPLVIIVGLIILFGSFVIVNPGERGVLLRWGAVTTVVFNEGLSFKVPIMDSVDIMDIKTQKLETQASAASSDLQVVTSTIALNYRIKAESVVYLRQNIGIDYKQKVIDPAIQEAIKAATAKFTAEQLITQRPLVRDAMKANLQEKLDITSGNSTIVVEFNIVNFDFSPSFNAAIEAKVTAEQNALAAKNKLEQIKYEAQQSIESAKGQAESIRVINEQLERSPKYLNLKSIEKWDGKMPAVLGSNSGLILTLPTETIS